MPPVTSSSGLADLLLASAGSTVLCVDDDRASLDRVRSVLERDGRLEVVAEVRPTEALRHLDRVDCVVSDHRMADLDGLELLAAVRERDPRLPFVLLTEDRSPDVADAVRSVAWTDHLRKGAVCSSPDLLSRRIHRLVGHRRRSEPACRALAAVETTPRGHAVVGPAGAFEFVDRTFADRFGYDRAELVGRCWRDVYPAPEVDRLESTAFPVAEEGWRWSGRCVGTRSDGGSFTARTTVTAPGDGRLVFVLSGPDDGDG